MDELLVNIEKFRKEERYERLAQLLKKNKIRLTHQRLLVLDYLATHKTHPSADDIYKSLKNQDPILSQATIYNTLNILVENNIIRELDFNEGFKRYDFEEDSHIHFICKSCKKIYDIDPGEIKMNFKDGEDFLIQSEEVILRGLCPKCRSKGRKAAADKI